MNYAARDAEASVEARGVLTQLRLMRPSRVLSLVEARRVAERQASKLLRLRSAFEAPIPDQVIADLPRVRVRTANLGSLSGVSHWDGACWQIAVNERHALVRQRFTMAHEFAHVLDAPFDRYVRPEHAEEVADYFAASFLMPKRLIKRMWGQGVQDIRTLVSYFNVSVAAMRWRLDELRLDDATDVPPLRGRCSGILPNIRQSLRNKGGSYGHSLAR